MTFDSTSAPRPPTTAPLPTHYEWPATPVAPPSTSVGVTIQQAATSPQLCALGYHAWVPWLAKNDGSFVTWCAREGCDHMEAWDE